MFILVRSQWCVSACSCMDSCRALLRVGNHLPHLELFLPKANQLCTLIRASVTYFDIIQDGGQLSDGACYFIIVT
jgi:hypothetical protein